MKIKPYLIHFPYNIKTTLTKFHFLFMVSRYLYHHLLQVNYWHPKTGWLQNVFEICYLPELLSWFNNVAQPIKSNKNSWLIVLNPRYVSNKGLKSA